jgi:3-deoxy-D-manno-octulosonate 8-phosphate phosphatase (KDO 8-P phosphatase)
MKIAIVSGRVSEATTIRARELGIKDVIQVADARKIQPLRALLERLDISFEEVAFVGDDIPDVALMKIVGMPVGVGNAVPEVKQLTRYTTARSGGDGAVREFAEALLKARGEWDNVVNQYVSSRQE